MCISFASVLMYEVVKCVEIGRLGGCFLRPLGFPTPPAANTSDALGVENHECAMVIVSVSTERAMDRRVLVEVLDCDMLVVRGCYHGIWGNPFSIQVRVAAGGLFLPLAIKSLIIDSGRDLPIVINSAFGLPKKHWAPD